MKSNLEILFLGENIKIDDIEKNKIIITFELEKEKKLNEKGIKTIYFHRQAQSDKIWNEIKKTSWDWWTQFPKKNIHNGKNILEILNFEDTSLWWFVHDRLWENKNGVFDTIYQIETIISILDEFNPKKITMLGKFEFPIDKMLNELNKKYKLKINDQSTYQESILQSDEIIKKRFRFLTRLLILKFVKLFSKKKKGNTSILSMHGGQTNPMKNGKKAAKDQYFIGLEKIFEKNKKNLNFVSLNKNIMTGKFSELVSNTLSGKYEPWIIYYSLRGILNAYNTSKDFKKNILKIENDPNFISAMSIKGINIFPFLRQQFIKNFPLLVGFTYLELAAAERFLSKNNPSTILTTEGFGTAAKALNYVCRKNGKTILTPQQGIISPEFPINMALTVVNGFDTRLLPDFLTWGKYFHKLIQDKGYPENFIKEIGFWKTNEKIISDKNKNYIFYIAGANRVKLEYVLSLEEEIFTIRQVHDSLPEGIKLMVKLHPNLDESPYFKTLVNLKNIILIGNNETVDVNQLINSSKIVIGKASTVIVQAMILGKPIIAVNFSGNVNFLGFEEIPFVTNVGDLKKTINEILHGDLENKYKINDYCHPIGDKAISNFVQKYMNS